MERWHGKSTKRYDQLFRNLQTHWSTILIIFSTWTRYRKKRQRITPFDITLFFRQLSTLITAGVSIVQSCDVLEKCQIKNSLRLLIYSIKKEVLAGKEFFHCLRAHPLYFDELICQLVNIGEHTGKLDTLLIIIADRQEKNLAMKKRVQQALFYPCAIAITALLITICMLIFVIPHFAELFQETSAKLPLFTLGIFFISRQLQQHLFLLLSIISFSLFLAFYPPFFTRIKRALKKIVFHLPFFRAYSQKIALARFSRNFAISFAAGIPINDALRLAGPQSDHPEFFALILSLRRHLNSGLALHHAMEILHTFPDLMIQMVKIGEESGMLEAMLTKIADFLEAEVDHLIKQLNQLLEPLIMLVLGVLIGGLIIGMYLPIFKLGNVL